MKNKIPQKLQGILWSKSVDTLDVKRDRVYIIHQVLSLGDMETVRWLFTVYPKSEIANVFVKFPKKIYQKATFHYVKDVLLGLDKTLFSPTPYVKHSP